MQLNSTSQRPHLWLNPPSMRRSLDSPKLHPPSKSYSPFFSILKKKNRIKKFEIWLQYAKTVDNTWSFILSAPDSSAYIGIGFSTNGQMTGASAVVGWIPTDGRGQAKQYLLGGKSPGEVKPDQGDLNIVNGSLKIESVSSRLYMSFQLTAELPRQILLYAMGPAGFIPASPGFSLREHRDMTTTTINYNTGKEAPPFFFLNAACLNN